MVSAPNHSIDVLIRKLESIAPLFDEERRAIEGLSVTVRPMKAGQDLVRDQDRPSQCCLILEGWACRYKLLKTGKRQIFSFHIPGDIPDLQSLHLSVMDHSVSTLTPATVALIPHHGLHELTARFPRIAAAFWRDTLVDAAIFREWMVGMGRRSATQAIAHQFCEMYLKLQAVGLAEDHIYKLPVTQSDIADALGMTNVHVNRVLKDLREKGLITLMRNTLQIHDWEEFTRLCEFDPTYLHLEQQAA
ncbi:Nitrogen fixation regulation protein FixK [Methylobacterium crusticola]|uniref:Nitrogen fixation regulation protein FixK n=1 Tax=Methylobacterium crusticola TaxID=1697972 RepID=A0ABQ4R7D3_9HYPH|nr:Crp/Fnr family transcriptional regulator [Methylobacterium crusticola]GJD53079.1 Nitrogen fixation regulation protein FixK [Methylobacterium crusticola]